MARKPRIWFKGAVYHITCRGNRRATLFYDDADRLMYLSLLEELRAIYPFYLHSFCLMTNHIHLQIETIDTHPQFIMKYLNSNYAIYFNKRYNFSGHVFQGRYGAKLIDSIDYFLKVSKYIHLNPVEAKITTKPELYPWSSYLYYVKPRENPYVTITTTRTLSYFTPPTHEKYREYVERKEDL